MATTSEDPAESMSRRSRLKAGIGRRLPSKARFVDGVIGFTVAMCIAVFAVDSIDSMSFVSVPPLLYWGVYIFAMFWGYVAYVHGFPDIRPDSE